MREKSNTVNNAISQETDWNEEVKTFSTHCTGMSWAQYDDYMRKREWTKQATQDWVVDIINKS